MAGLALLILLAGCPIIAAVPSQVGEIRLAGLSLLWWYGGLVVPVLGALIAVAAGRPPAPPSEPE